VIIEGCKHPKSVTILIRGGNRMACEETITSLYDSLWVVRDCLIDNRIVVGGGATEVELHRNCMKYAMECKGLEQ
jgi:chaperonin GroEL (HSP60 family)